LHPNLAAVGTSKDAWSSRARSTEQVEPFAGAPANLHHIHGRIGIRPTLSAICREPEFSHRPARGRLRFRDLVTPSRYRYCRMNMNMERWSNCAPSKCPLRNTAPSRGSMLHRIVETAGSVRFKACGTSCTARDNPSWPVWYGITFCERGKQQFCTTRGQAVRLARVQCESVREIAGGGRGFAMTVEAVEHGHQVTRQKQRRKHPAHHHDRQRPLRLGTDLG
jgi:hypothetical protein